MPDPPAAEWTLPPGWTVARVRRAAPARAARPALSKAAVFPDAFTEPGRVEVAAEYRATRRSKQREEGARARLHVEARPGESYVVGLKRESGAISFHPAVFSSEPVLRVPNLRSDASRPAPARARRLLEFHLPLASVPSAEVRGPIGKVVRAVLF